MTDNMSKHTVHFCRSGIDVIVEDGANLLEIMHSAGEWTNSLCGGNGTCGKCAVKIICGEKTEIVLACQYRIKSDILAESIDPTEESAHKILKTGIKRKVAVDPDVDKGEFVDKKYYLMVFDIGTTTVAGYLLDGTSGTEICSISRINPQVQYGADVISRAQYVIEHTGDAVSSLIRGTINDMLNDVAMKAGIVTKDIASVTVACNTCMHHMLLNLPIKQLVTAPYEPAEKDSLVLSAREYGININPKGKLICFPNIAGFVGGDTAAAMLAVEIDKSEAQILLIDIGTNGEIVIGNKKKYIACSTAAGPAFEGAKISCGMRGTSGAIEHVIFEENGIFLKVIDDKKPIGICGSGLFDVIAGMRKFNVIDSSGKIAGKDNKDLLPAFKKRILEDENGSRFVICSKEESKNGEDICITQRDVREVQLAKSAISSGIIMALDAINLHFNDISQIMLAGAFGTYISPESVCDIGIIPREYKDKIIQIGNAAGEGAKIAAINKSEYERVQKIVQNAEALSLISDKRFQEHFVDELMFPE